MRLGEEAGLPRELERALTEMRRGAPIEPEEQGALTRTLGASRVVVSRVVGAPIETVRRAVDKFHRASSSRPCGATRRPGRVGAGAEGIWPGLVRSLDFSKRYAFALVNRVETVLSEEGTEGGETAVAFNIDLTEMRRERFGQMETRRIRLFCCSAWAAR